MPLSKRVRFEVFKRDAFTCQYCGRKTPDVTLHVDHIHPRAEGGTDDFENLLTACSECNLGKGARTLDSRTEFGDMIGRAESIREREEQIRAYHAAQDEAAERRRQDFTEVYDYWFELYREESMSRYHIMADSALRRYVEALGVEDVKEAMDIAFHKYSWPCNNAVKYCYGVLRRKLARREGRIVSCGVCGKDVELAQDQDPTREWRHAGCEES